MKTKLIQKTKMMNDLAKVIAGDEPLINKMVAVELAISQSKEELIEEIKRMKKQVNSTIDSENLWREGYNSAIDNILNEKFYN